MIRAVIVDDEKKGRELLNKVLSKYCNQVKVVGQAETAHQAYEVINKVNPNLVFLDIEMPNGSGFDLLKMFDKLPFFVIFTTAYDQYAVKAIKYAAVDYLLKPIDIDELQLSIKKVVEKLSVPKGDQNADIDVLITALKSKKIAIPDHEGVTIVDDSDIIICQADSNYTNIFLTNNERMVSTKTLKEYNSILNEEKFLRVHNSYIINIDHVKKYIKGEGGQVLMSNDDIVEVSRRRKGELLQAILGN